MRRRVRGRNPPAPCESRRCARLARPVAACGRNPPGSPAQSLAPTSPSCPGGDIVGELEAASAQGTAARCLEQSPPCHSLARARPRGPGHGGHVWLRCLGGSCCPCPGPTLPVPPRVAKAAAGEGLPRTARVSRQPRRRQSRTAVPGRLFPRGDCEGMGCWFGTGEPVRCCG